VVIPGNDHAPLSVPQVSGPSRRTVLRAAGALGIAGAALRAAPASAATAFRGAPADVSEGPSFAGANQKTFETMLSINGPTPTPALSPLPTALRVYMDDNTYPNITGYANFTWPDLVTEYNSPARALISIRPECEMLAEGTFDADLHKFMMGAPTNGRASLLTIWHECATFTLNNANYPKKPAIFREALAHLQALAAGEVAGFTTPTNVKVGVVDVNPSDIPANSYPDGPGSAYNEWMVANLDWYGCDLYDSSSLDLSVYAQLNSFREYVNTLSGSVANADAPICLPECNSRPYTAPNGTVYSTKPTTGPTGFRRSDFFHYAWAWLQNLSPGGECSGLLGFWNGPGKEGSPWPPADTPIGSLAAMVEELSAENAQSSP
jgi:hypothetical protein